MSTWRPSAFQLSFERGKKVRLWQCDPYDGNIIVPPGYGRRLTIRREDGSEVSTAPIMLLRRRGRYLDLVTVGGQVFRLEHWVGETKDFGRNGGGGR